MTKLVINARLDDHHIARVASVSAAVDVVVALGSATADAIADAQILFGWPTPELFKRARQLAWVQTISTGVDHLLFPELVDSSVILTSTKGIVGTHLADHAFALLLAVTRGIVGASRAARWDWDYDPDALIELDGLTMGVLGVGGSGREVAKRAKAFGMHVIGIDSEPMPTPAGVDELWRESRLPDMLERADVVTICAPLTPRTKGLFDADAFARMKPGAILINVSRGAIVNGDALTAALTSRRLRGAGLDATWEEPLPDAHPLWTMPNAIVTPHVAGISPRFIERSVELCCDNLRRFLDGQPLVSVVDKAKGY